MKFAFRRLDLPEGFRISFPQLSGWVARPAWVMIGAGLLAVTAAAFSGWVNGCAALCLSTPFLALALERNLLGRILLPPFTVWAFWSALGTGLGVPILASFPGPVPIEAYLKVQLVYLAIFPIAAGCYFLAAGKVLTASRIAEAWERLAQNPGREVFWLGWGWFLFSVVLMGMKCGLGLEDRAAGNPRYQADWNPFGGLTLLSVFTRIDMLGFFFFPLLWKQGSRPVQGILLLLAGTALGMALPSGARGLVLYPLCFFLAGGYFFRRAEPRSYERKLSVLAVTCLIMILALLAYRGCEQYHQADTLAGKSRALISFLQSPKISRETWLTYGYSLLGVEDAKVYATQHREAVRAGWEGFQALPFTWIPTFFFRDKPSLLDGAKIAGSVQSPPIQEMRGYGISLPADAYRRFGWAGVAPVIAFYFLLYGLVARYLFDPVKKNPSYAVACGLFGTGFFLSHAFATVLTTWHTFFYTLPKNLLPLWLVCRWLEGRRGNP